MPPTGISPQHYEAEYQNGIANDWKTWPVGPRSDEDIVYDGRPSLGDREARTIYRECCRRLHAAVCRPATPPETRRPMQPAATDVRIATTKRPRTTTTKGT